MARSRVWGGIVLGVALLFRGWAHLNRFLDTNIVDGSFDKGCEELEMVAASWPAIQSGRVQTYLRLLALAVVVLAAILIWGGRAMNGIPVCDTLHHVPVVGAAIALFSGKHARGVAIITTLVSLVSVACYLDSFARETVRLTLKNTMRGCRRSASNIISASMAWER